MSNLFKAIIYGPAATQGSKCQFPHPTSGKMVMIETGKKSRSWRQELIQEMLNDAPEKPFDEAVFVRVRIYVNRPKAHFDKYGYLKPNAPNYPKSGLDVDKIQRLIGDAGKIAGWFVNDSRIAGWNSLRLYTTEDLETERVEIHMWSLQQFGEDFYDRVVTEATTRCYATNPTRVARGVTWRDIDE